jgi:Coenzyme PQQ synthesis protein D (PqqD)
LLFREAAKVVKLQNEEARPMLDPSQAPPSPIASEPAVDCTMLARTILRPNPDVQGTNMEGETVLLNLSSGRYYTLNRIGSIIWEHCTSDKTLSEIHTVLCNRFDVSPERALEDLVTLVNQLIQEGLLQQEDR